MSIEINTGNEEAPDQIKSDSRSLLIALSSGVEFGLELKDTRGVSSFGRIIPIPGTAPAILGVTYFRGGIEAAVDLGVVWNGSSIRNSSKSRAILIEAEGRRAVLIVDTLIDLYDCNPSDLNLNHNVWPLTGQIGEINFSERKAPFISVALLLQSIA